MPALGLALGLPYGRKAASGFVGVLDDYEASLESAYSVARRLLASYSGDLIRVRRSGDNAEADFGFDVAGDLDSAALMAWVVAGGGTQHGHVTTVYDQLAGAPGNILQGTAAQQPRIVISGVLQTASNSRPAGDASTYYTYAMKLSYSRVAADFSCGGVMSARNDTLSQCIFALADYDRAGYNRSDTDPTKLAHFNGIWTNGGTASAGIQSCTLRSSGSDWAISKDGTNVVALTNADSRAWTNPIFWAGASDGYGSNSQIQEAWIAFTALDDTTTHAIETALLA